MLRWPIVHWEAVKVGILGSQASSAERRVPQCVVLVSYLDREGGEMTYVGHSWSGATDSRSRPHLDIPTCCNHPLPWAYAISLMVVMVPK